jgi:hypothetical protein
MALKDAFERLKGAIGDLSCLDVQSYSGKLTATIQGDGEGNIIDWKKLVVEARKLDGTVSLKLASHFNFDGDATLFAAEGQIPEDLRKAHDEAVTAGQQIRKDIFDLFADTIKKLA